MGGSSSKDEVVVAQTASDGNNQAQLELELHTLHLIYYDHCDNFPPHCTTHRRLLPKLKVSQESDTRGAAQTDIGY